MMMMIIIIIIIIAFQLFSTAQKIITDTLQKQKNYRFVQLHNYTYNDGYKTDSYMNWGLV